ncbi:hypothetical protein SELMODRAFT_430695 [Selaginella moellendorffii]|uniref:F-box domain-containing protein n=1 Tax=Selaginella moellendorffii TaxID=88036 RepID=D8TA71_SELML|nr:hypothetical protein SELMODRAFT_430695 [Selaginella moellendorffii]
MEAKKASACTTIDSLPDAVLALILDIIKYNVMYLLVSKRWHRIGKELGLVIIDLHDLHEDKPPEGRVFKLVQQSIRQLLIHKYHYFLHKNYSWITSIATTLEELTIEGVKHQDSTFDLELVSKACPKLKFVSFYRLHIVARGEEFKYQQKAPLSLTFPALTHCSLDRVIGLDLATELLPSCPVLEELSLCVYHSPGALSSSSLRVLSLETIDGSGILELDLPNLETAWIGDCEKLKMRAPRLKSLSLGNCGKLVGKMAVPGELEIVCNALETLTLRLALQSIVLFGREGKLSELQQLAACVANIPVTILPRN